MHDLRSTVGSRSVAACLPPVPRTYVCAHVTNALAHHTGDTRAPPSRTYPRAHTRHGVVDTHAPRRGTRRAGTYGSIGMLYGGPAVMLWAWPLAVLFNLSVAASMAELASAYPTSGALYYYAYALAPARCKVLVCWLTGWILVMGQAAFSTLAFCSLVSEVAAVLAAGYGEAGEAAGRHPCACSSACPPSSKPWHAASP
jgi:hypothetical protein